MGCQTPPQTEQGLGGSADKEGTTGQGLHLFLGLLGILGAALDPATGAADENTGEDQSDLFAGLATFETDFQRVHVVILVT